jgi:hypothetical protein
MVLSLTAFLPGRGEDTPKNRYYGKPYDAVSEMVTPDGRRVTTRVQCDGNGKVRNEMTSRSGTSYTIMDCNTKQVSTVIEQSKMIMKSKAPDQALSSEEQREKTDVKQLGTQTIDGHPCKGESYTSKGAKYEIWRAIDIDYPIKTVCETSRGKSEMKLKSFSSTPPPKSAFQLPTGYKEVNPAALTTPR